MSAELSAISGSAISGRASGGGSAAGGAIASRGAVIGSQRLPAAKPPGWKPGVSPGRARLRKVTPAPKPDEIAEVVFAFNPERITLSHTYTNTSTQATNLDDQIKTLGFLEITLSKLYLIGDLTKANAQALLDWSRPLPTTTPCGNGKQKKSEPSELRFSWGSGLTWKVRMRSVNISYVRFTSSGKPTRAEVTIGIYSSLANQLPPSGNPTSGGPAGRSAHVLDSSECLASLAAANYDKPGAWRRIASANGIDDPLRVAPGTQIYLPEPGELVGGAGGTP